METILKTDLTFEKICEGFEYNEYEGKGLYGLGGSLIIQPEYQRNYIYTENHKDEAVINFVLKGYPLGVVYFNRRKDGMLEVLDGQQRITSIGRFKQGRFAVEIDGNPMIFSALSKDLQKKFLNTVILVYECEGTENEIKEWFQKAM